VRGGGWVGDGDDDGVRSVWVCARGWAGVCGVWEGGGAWVCSCGWVDGDGRMMYL